MATLRCYGLSIGLLVLFALCHLDLVDGQSSAAKKKEVLLFFVSFVLILTLTFFSLHQL